VRRGRMSCWIGERKEKKKKDNRSNSKNRKLTIIKLTTTTKPKKSMGRDEQINKKQKQTNKQKTPGLGTIEFQS
jgi:hypothetical protein